jgi:hypothetical protein
MTHALALRDVQGKPLPTTLQFMTDFVVLTKEAQSSGRALPCRVARSRIEAVLIRSNVDTATLLRLDCTTTMYYCMAVKGQHMSTTAAAA